MVAPSQADWWKGPFFLTTLHSLTPSWQPSDWEKNVYPAGDWALEERATPRMVMGRDSRILWADGESLVIVADTGYGKSSLSNNIVQAGIGLADDVLGFEVRRFERVLYIAADRPMQTRYNLRRMITEDTREYWNEHVHIHDGPLPFYLNEKPEYMGMFAKMTREKWGAKPADCVIIDSLMNVATGLSDDEEGIKVNAALQAVCREGIQLLVTHHPRKGQSMRGKKGDDNMPTLDDVFGSKFITGGAGSVIYLHNHDIIDGSLEVTHLKSPAGPVDFHRICFENETGKVQWVL